MNETGKQKSRANPMPFQRKAGGHDLTSAAATALRLPIDKSTLHPDARRAAWM